MRVHLVLTPPLTLALALLASAVARVARADGPSCAADWTGAVYTQVRPAVVRVVASNAETGTGFFFQDTCHVATALHVVDAGRSLRIDLANGGVLAGNVVAVHYEHDLAILATDPAPPRPTSSRSRPRPWVAGGRRDAVDHVGESLEAPRVDRALHGIEGHSGAVVHVPFRYGEDPVVDESARGGDLVLTLDRGPN